MQELYATTFTLASSTGRSPFDLALDAVAAWSGDRVGRTPDLTESTGEIQTNEGWTLNWSNISDPDEGRRAMEARLTHPDRLTPSMRWATSVVLSKAGATTRSTIRLTRAADDLALRPSKFEMKPPGVVARLLDRPLAGYSGTIELRPIATTVGRDTVSSLLNDVLLNPGRVLPVLVLASPSTLPIAPSELARRLVGLAHVTVFQDQDVWQAFRDEVGRDAYVPPGGIRIYWPGFGSGDGIHHRYWPKSRLARTPFFETRVRRMLAPLSVVRVPRDRVLDEIRLNVARQVVEQLRAEGQPEEQDPTAVEELRTLEERYNALETEALEALDKAQRLEAENSALADANASLSERLNVAQENLRAAYEWQEVDEEDEEDEQPREPPDSWSELAERISDLESPGLELTDRARDCAAQNSYPSPERMWIHLEKLSRAGEAYSAARSRVGQRFAEWVLEKWGLDVALTDSTYGNHTFEFDGVELSRLPHVKIDDAVAPNEVGRIYFAIDSDRSRLVVDWFGVKRERP